MSSAPASRPRATMSASMNYEWLWVDDPIIITRWFITQPRLSYKEFYASFMNSANKALERSRQKDCLALEGLPKFIVALLHKQPIPAEELLAALKAYAMDDLGNGHGRYKTKGLLPFGRGLSHETLTAGKNELRRKVFSDRTRALAAPPTATTSLVPATMANQQALPAFVAPPAPASVPPLRLWVPPPPREVNLPTPSGLELASFFLGEQPLSLERLEEVMDDLGPAAGKRAQEVSPVVPVQFGNLPLARAKEDEKMGDEEEDEIL
ncbi:hypothetical protein D6C86_02666 [Aureobasidium pullulans]|uniref:Uncharacterized protein n=1 Tax=Aureobasidium pullulans TaxID=5580 RepID=A0A4S9V6L1_AURPU|nr:hypothetical protein D6C94_01715 [Aureobasidium pullulans]THZ47250.1 hypothetical protein D6C87_01600 [Aureobasidium pullulans]THZ49731.1 hypothetical protein D6C88_09942 [Aureobasidium pullulans]THZ64264.1 hypothetical protein D6C86_02666 [Aureobasidium pullulans]